MQQRTLIKKIGECLSEEGRNFRLDTPLYELEGWDPVGRLLISALIGQLFKKSIDQAILLSCKTIGDIVDLVKEDLDR